MDMRQLREKVKLRTVDVAAKLNVADSTVRNWEHGRSVPKFELIKPLLKLYDISFDELETAIQMTLKGRI